ncbi:hypothetical protein NDU88_000396 [Pleurodeles waltl]|uniref:Uncharacterized protein n=1 Tax=Pleurodeles waltl TaxID=8319 RepID=A0AAV7KM25_PLEWA|nr:hypothetical protein NDU88_000396 [Pleurodeles waltl]
MSVLDVADERMFSDVRLREFLRDSDLAELEAWFEDGRLVSSETVLGEGHDTALHQLYLLRVCAMLRARFAGLPETPPVCQALEM